MPKTKVLWPQYMATHSQNALSDLKKRLGVHHHHHHHHASHFSGADSVGGGSGGEPGSPGGGLSLGDESTLASVGSESVASQVSEYSLAPFIAEMVGASLAAKLDPLPKVSAAAQEDRLLRSLVEESRAKHAQNKKKEISSPTNEAPGANALPMPLPAGMLCAGRVPWGATRYFEVLVDDPAAILTINLVATAAVNLQGGDGGGGGGASAGSSVSSLPILTANANAQETPSLSTNHNSSSSAFAKSALGRAILAEPFGGSASSNPPLNDNNEDDPASPSPNWTIEEVERRRPAGLAKADLFVRKVRPQEEDRGGQGAMHQRLPSPSDFDWKSCSTGPKDRLVIYPGPGGRRGCEGGAGR